MGFAFTLLFLMITHLSIDHLVPEMAPYRPMLWLSLLGILLSFLSIPQSGSVLRSPSVYVFLAFYFFLPTSRVLHGWLGGAFPALTEFLPSVVMFFLILVNTTTAFRAKLIMIGLLLASFYMGAKGIIEYHTLEGESEFVFSQKFMVDRENVVIEEIRRVRSVGFLADPNDFAQFILLVMPALGLLHRKRSPFFNFFLIGIPLPFLLYTLYLTRSRGGALGLIVLIFLFVRDRVSAVTSMLMTGVAAVVGLGLQFGAGRAISLSSGSDRLDIWSDGLGMFKGSPLWGVGFRAFTETSKVTAHNSYLLVASELGLLGLFLWMGIIVYCIYSLHWLNKRLKAGEVAADWAPLVRVIYYSFMGFLTTSYFLSRSYSMDFYILFALIVVLAVRAVELPQKRTETAPAETAQAMYGPQMQNGSSVPLSFSQWFTYDAIASFGVLISIYISVRMRSF